MAHWLAALLAAVVARPARGEVVRVTVPSRCTVLRARVDGGWSGAVYANCGLR
ncbi:MAG: hypothetical protein R3A52_32525 [Polyangiales bacterium]